MFIKITVTFILSVLLLASCANQNLEKNLEELDKVYGRCDNPHRQYGEVEYRICKDKERAGSNSEPFNISKFLADKSSSNIEIVPNRSMVNQDLWNSSLSVLEDYSLKIADNEGGFVETDWIYENQTRCLIKIQIISAELISTGVKTKILCQKNNNDLWVNDNIVYTDEEKKLTLRILELASLNNQLN